MKILFYIFCIVFFIGCTTLPKQEELIAQNNIPQNFKYQKMLAELAEINSIEEKDFIKTFFKIFDDKVLHNLIFEALKANTNLLTLESKIVQAKSNIKIDTASMFPSASLNLNYNHSAKSYKNVQVNYNQNSLNATASLSWEVDLFGKLNALRQADTQAYLASQKNLENAKVSLIADIATYYYTILQLQNSISINKRIIENLEKIFKITKQKYDFGLVDISTLSSAKNTLSSQKNTLLNLEYALEQNKNALLVLLNKKDLDFNFDAYKILTPPHIPYIQALPATTILNRPDVSSSIYSFQSSLYKRTNKKLSLLPSINLNGSLGQLLLSSAGMGDLIWQIASSLAMPLLNRQSITQAYIIAKEDSKQAYYTLQNTINVALQEINNASVNLKTSKESLDNSKEGFDFFTSTLASTKVKYNQKLIDDLSFFEVENNYLNAKNSLVNASLQLHSALIVIYKAFGGNLSHSQEQQ